MPRAVGLEGFQRGIGHGGVQLGDTITDGSVNLLYTGLPFFAPEMFMTVVLKKIGRAHV